MVNFWGEKLETISGKKGTIFDIVTHSFLITGIIAFVFYLYCFLDQILLNENFHMVSLVIMLTSLVSALCLYKVRKEIKVAVPFAPKRTFRLASILLAFAITLAVLIPYYDRNLLFYRIFHTWDWFYSLILAIAVFAVVFNLTLCFVRIVMVLLSRNICCSGQNIE